MERIVFKDGTDFEVRGRDLPDEACVERIGEDLKQTGKILACSTSDADPVRVAGVREPIES